MATFLRSKIGIPPAGVFRCCIASVGLDADVSEKVAEGTISKCRYCKEEFILVERDGKPVWLPKWRVEHERMYDKLSGINYA